jgi:radical SAM protein with 4Fe4S-binding SPASM domain
MDNINEHSEHVPGLIGWEITGQCNLSCPHCYSAAGRKPYNEMTMGECKRIIDSMAALGVGTIGWTGGEPLLRDDLEELTGYAAEKGIACNVTTNAILLDAARAKRLSEAGMTAVQISLDGSTAERNYRIRRTTDEEFNLIISAIRHCKEVNLQVHMATLLGRDTLDDARNMVELAKREGVDIIRFCGFAPIGRGKRNDITERMRFSDTLKDLLQFVEEAQDDDTMVMTFDTSFGPVPPEFGFHKCIAGVETFYLKGNGDIYPCTSLLNKRFLVGNINERPLEQLWNDPKMRAVSSYPSDRIEGPCRACDNFDYCHGACRGASLAHTGNINASFPLCLYRTARDRKILAIVE